MEPDKVTVVRCADCEFWASGRCQELYDIDDFGEAVPLSVRPEFYCGWGMEKEREVDDE